MCVMWDLGCSLRREGAGDIFGVSCQKACEGEISKRGVMTRVSLVCPPCCDDVLLLD